MVGNLPAYGRLSGRAFQLWSFAQGLSFFLIDGKETDIKVPFFRLGGPRRDVVDRVTNDH